jgi:hypothetical protein
MWKSFPTNNATGVAAFNGEVAISADLTAPAYHALLRINFIKDMAVNHRDSGGPSVQGVFLGTLSDASDNLAGGTPYWGGYDANYARPLVNTYCNDCAITVLPNAPIDPATNLPIPTIAVATDGGVSVIKDDGSVVDITYTTIYKVIQYIAFTKENHIIFSNDGYNALQRWVKVYEIPSADQTTASGSNRSGALYSYVGYDTAGSYGPNPEHMFPDGMKVHDITSNAIATDDVGVIRITDDGKSLAYITSDYNTGYQVGDIKLAALSDTDDTDVVGTPIYSETFGTDTAGWSGDSGGLVTWNSGGYLVVDRGTGDYVYAAYKTGLGWTTGKQYVLSFRVNPDNTGKLRVRCDTQQWDSTTLTANAWQTITINVTPTADRIEIGSESGAGIDQFLLDDIYLYPVDQDRSVNNNGLQVHGTIDKDPVATGADLVAYSGFSSSNYLSQPPNTDLDFGTGDFCAMGWFKSNTGTGGNEAFFFRGQTDTNGYAMIEPYIRQDGKVDVLTRNAAEGYGFFTTTTSVLTQQWVQWCMVRSSGVMYFYLNGVVDGSQADTRNLTPSTSAKKTFRIGNSWNGQKPIPGSVALFRISATAPTAEQIKKIYEDEKPLFQEGAKATLYDTSDAVTALAYDDDTGLLHVGNADGRSVFQGLRRVSNTTDAVTKCISASNDLVVEG